MDLKKDFREFAESLNAAGVKYVVVGGYAVAFHGLPRYTKDIDFLVEPSPENGVRLLDALKRFGITEKPENDTTGCRCGEVLCGLIDPPQCELFGQTCEPQNPVGPCMVSSEGACAAWFKYDRKVKRGQ